MDCLFTMIASWLDNTFSFNLKNSTKHVLVLLGLHGMGLWTWKQQIDLDGAIELAGKVKEGLQKLEASLRLQENKKDLALERTLTSIDKCSSVQSILKALDSSTQDRHQQLKTELEEALKSLKSIVEDWGNFNFQSFLEGIFTDTVQLKIEGAQMGDIRAAVVEGQSKT